MVNVSDSQLAEADSTIRGGLPRASLNEWPAPQGYASEVHGAAGRDFNKSGSSRWPSRPGTLFAFGGIGRIQWCRRIR